MARIRSTKPEHWSNANLAKVSFGARLTFMAMWNIADDSGRGLAIAKSINGFVFPYDSIDDAVVEGFLQELHTASLIDLYEVDGLRYFEVQSWPSMQVINRPAPSRYPAKPLTDISRKARTRAPKPALTSHGHLTDMSVSPQCTLTDISLEEQGTGNREQGTGSHGCANAQASRPLTARLPKDQCDPNFEEFWKRYPKKQAKPDARRSWERLKPDADTVTRILKAVELWKRSQAWRKDHGTYIPMPTTFLNQERYNDVPIDVTELDCETTEGERDPMYWQRKHEEEDAARQREYDEYMASTTPEQREADTLKRIEYGKNVMAEAMAARREQT